ncbi:MAG TPA: hypothetical protein PKY25_02610 [Bacilli bacterium]|nr:hypothetical protein [Bacilli bacterium]
MNNNENNITPNDMFNSQVPNSVPEEPKVEEQAPVVPTPPVETPSVVPEPATPVVPTPSVESTPTLQFNLLSPWAYIGYNILFSLPIIGLIMMIVFAVDKDTYNVNRRNYARSMLYAMLLVAAISTAIIIIFVVFLDAAATDFMNYFNQMTTTTPAMPF